MDQKLIERAFKAIPRCREPELWIPAIAQAATNQGLSPRALPMFLAQTAHESQSFNVLRESMNYTAQRLMAVWPKRFQSLSFAQRYANNPVALANYVYAGRLGNGTESSGDGWNFRGGGLIQVTGRGNYRKLGPEFEANPRLIEEKQLAADSAVRFWVSNRLDAVADDIEQCTQRINGGRNGIEEREQFFTHIRRAIG